MSTPCVPCLTQFHRICTHGRAVSTNGSHRNGRTSKMRRDKPCRGKLRSPPPSREIMSATKHNDQINAMIDSVGVGRLIFWSSTRVVCWGKSRPERFMGGLKRDTCFFLLHLCTSSPSPTPRLTRMIHFAGRFVQTTQHTAGGGQLRNRIMMCWRLHSLKPGF